VVRSPAIFLRVECALPDGLHLHQKPFDRAWRSVENAAPPQLDLAVRDAGWHFMWVESACSRFGCGWTDEAASTRAIARALTQTLAKFNAAELGLVRISRYFGLRVARATLHTRHIQRGASLGLLDGPALQQRAPE